MGSRGATSSMVKTLTKQQLEEIHSIFSVFDKDNSGSISVEEFGDVWRSLGQNPSKKELDNLLKEIDADGSGEIDFDEFCDLVAKYGTTYENEEDELKAAFKLFDPEGNGYINSEQLRQILTILGEQLSPEEINEMIAEADDNGDGKVDYEEFVEVMMKGSREEEEEEEEEIVRKEDAVFQKYNHHEKMNDEQLKNAITGNKSST